MESLRNEREPSREQSLMERVKEQARYTVYSSSWSRDFSEKKKYRSGESGEMGGRIGRDEALVQAIDPHVIPKLEQFMKEQAAAEGVTIMPATSAKFLERMKAIVYRVKSAAADGQGHMTPSNRPGSSFRGLVILPEELAQEVFEKIQKDPEYIRFLFEELDSEMMADQKQHMPASSRIVVAPEGTLSSKSKTKPTTHDISPLRDAA